MMIICLLRSIINRRSTRGSLVIPREPRVYRMSVVVHQSSDDIIMTFHTLHGYANQDRRPRCIRDGTWLGAVVCTLLIIGPLLTITTGSSSSVLSKNDTDRAVRYLKKYGYLNDSETTQPISSVEASSSVENALTLFQEYYRLPGKRGNLNEATLNLIRKPRCGLADFPNRAIGQVKRKWPRTNLRWNFHLARPELLTTTHRAFDLWAEQTALTFRRDSRNPDILLSFRGGVHNNIDQQKNGKMCISPLDGPGLVLGHAFYPTGNNNYTAEVHIDDAEPWYIYLDENPAHMYNLLQTLTHEIGHALGLPHSENADSIMYAYTPSKDYPVTLAEEDIRNIQQLYGTRTDGVHPTATPMTTTTTTTTTTPQPRTTTTTMTPRIPRDHERDLCSLSRIDSVLVLDEKIFVSHGRQVWPIDTTGKNYDRPLALNDYMRFLPNNFTRLSGAYQTPLGDLVLFVNKMVYMVRYPSYELIDGWPRSQEDFGLPPNIRVNTALSTNKGRAYVLYDNGYVGEIDNCQMRVVKHNMINTIFPGIPLGITTAFRHIDGHLYFVNRKQFYKYNEFTRSVTAAGKMDLQIIGVVCPRDELLEQIRDLLDRLVRINNVLAYTREDENDD